MEVKILQADQNFMIDPEDKQLIPQEIEEDISSDELAEQEIEDERQRIRLADIKQMRLEEEQEFLQGW